MIIGIDIGTSNSSVCFINEKGDAVPVNISTGMSMYGSNFSMPSAVYVEDDGNVLVGQAALNSRLRKPQCFRAEFKRNLGESIPILLGSRSFLPEDLYTELFRHMLTCVQKLGQGQVEKTYVTHPASYGQDRKNKILSAAKAAGLFDVTLVDEPTSAAMHYLHLGYLKDGQTLLVYDFGGGTFDAALIQYKDGLFKALTEPLGLEHCGGIDIDRAIFADILSQISADTLKPLQANSTQRLRLESKLAELAVKAKHHLTASTIYQEYIDIGWDGFEYTLTQDKLNGMLASLVQKTIDCCRGILAEANLSVDKLDGILLVGGTSRIPLVMQMLGQFAGNVPILSSVDLELAVAQGAMYFKDIEPPGPGLQTLHDPNRQGFAVLWDGWVYFNDDGGIAKMDINGEHKSLFMKGEYSDLYAHNGFIYTATIKDDENVKLIRISMKEKTVEDLTDLAKEVMHETRLIENRLYYRVSNENGDSLKSINLLTKQINVHISNVDRIYNLTISENNIFVSWDEKLPKTSRQYALYNEYGNRTNFHLMGRKDRSLRYVSTLYNPKKGYYGYITKEYNGITNALCFYDYAGTEKYTIDIKEDMDLYYDNDPVVSGSSIWLYGLDRSYKGVLYQYDLDERNLRKVKNINHFDYYFTYQVIGKNLYYYDDENIVRTMPIELELLSIPLELEYDHDFDNADNNDEVDDEGDADDPELQFHLGALHEENRHFDAAFCYYMKAALQGYAEAQHYIGYLYADGKWVAPDLREAFEWYMKAAQQGYAQAQCMVGFSYDHGKGIEQDSKKAFEWYMKAAIQGNANAQNNVGVAYFNGNGAEKNRALAKIYFEKAAAQGNETAISNLKLVQ